MQHNVAHVFNPEYGGRNAGPSYGNLSFSHNHNPAGEIHRSVGGNGHTRVGAHTHGHVGLHGSHNCSGSNITADMCAHGCGSTGSYSHGGGGINMAFTGNQLNHSNSYGSPSPNTAAIVNCSVIHNPSSNRWIVDTGATNHMTSTQICFVRLNFYLQPSSIKFICLMVNKYLLFLVGNLD